MQPPPGVRYVLTPLRLAVIRALSQALRPRLILVINFEADSRVIAASEARALIAGVGSGTIEALELGNEPELYRTFGWYRTPSGAEVPGRRAGWAFPMFNREFTAIASALPAAPLAGPATGNPWWDPDLGDFLRSEPRVRIATVHRYPLWICSDRASQVYPTAAHLLSAGASAGLAASVSQLVRVAHGHEVPLRIDEMNMTPCRRRALELRSSFAAALWALAVLFEMASVGADGVNVQTTTATTSDLFTFKHIRGRAWGAAVTPEYYCLLMFAEAVPAGSRLVALSPAPPASIHAWASRSPDGAARAVGAAGNPDGSSAANGRLDHNPRALRLGRAPVARRRDPAPSPRSCRHGTRRRPVFIRPSRSTSRYAFLRPRGFEAVRARSRGARKGRTPFPARSAWLAS
jgi:hypothetical protein